MPSAQTLTAPSSPTTPDTTAETLPAAEQWLTATAGRVATDRFSWMQAVCWFRIDDGYRRGRGHGPRRVGDTTLRVAVELARLAPCRPGVDYLVRVLKLSRRTVQYHLGILRETGLLTYRTKGTRVRGQGGQASEFVWTIPQAFDKALHLRTRVCEEYIRVVRGIGDEGRALMKRVSTMAQRQLRSRRRTRRNSPVPAPSSGTSRCTPMVGSSSLSSSAATTTYPSESKLEAGNHHVSSCKPSRNRRKLNAVGRRHQLARELIQQVPWLHRASVPRIAWIVRELSDAGWSATEVMAVLAQEAPARTVHRPSGFLASRLSGAHRLFATVERRNALVTWWRDSRQAEQDRHTEWEAAWQEPRSRTVNNLVRQAVDSVRFSRTSTLPADDDSALTDEQLRAHRETAHQAYLAGDTGLITSTITHMGRAEAERLYGAELVARAVNLNSTSSHLKVRTLR